MTFIGPSPEAIRRMGDKSEARWLMAVAGVPVLPGSEGPVGGAEEAARVAAAVGFPVILNPAAGGGGIGMARVNGAGELAAAFATASRRPPSAAAPFTSSGIWSGRGTWRSRSSATAPAASCTCTSARARSSGATRSWSTSRRPRGSGPPPRRGSTQGRPALARPPGLRVESGVEAGTLVSIHYDPLLFKLIAVGGSRAEALDRMGAALGRSVVEGVRTTLPFLRRVLEHAEVRAGRLDTQMIERGVFA